MGRVVFLSLPFYGHTNPAVGLVRELVKRGEEVIYYSTSEFKSRIEAEGAVFKSYRSLEAVYSHNGVDSMDKIINSIRNVNDINSLAIELHRDVKASKGVIDDIYIEVEKIKPDYIIHDSGAMWGKIIARKLNLSSIAYITTLAYCDKIFDKAPEFAVKNILKLDDSYLNNVDNTKKMVSTLSKSVGKLYGMENIEFLDRFFSIENLNIVFTSEMFQPYSECFDSSYKFVGPSIYDRGDKTGFPFERLDSKPLIYIAMGSHLGFSERCMDLYKKCFEAFGNENVQVVLAKGKNIDKGLLDEVPDNFIIESFVPQIEILERTQLFITHGGMNSVSEGLYHGIPLIVFPQVTDQFMNATRVEELGAGVYIKESNITTEFLKSVAEKLLFEEGYRNRSREIASSFKESGGCSRAAEEILDYISISRR